MALKALRNADVSFDNDHVFIKLSGDWGKITRRTGRTYITCFHITIGDVNIQVASISIPTVLLGVDILHRLGAAIAFSMSRQRSTYS